MIALQTFAPLEASETPPSCSTLRRPLLLASDDGFAALTSEYHVTAAAQQQIDSMRATGYGRSDVLGSEVTVLNATAALYSAHARAGALADGTAISRLTVTHLVTDGPVGRRISTPAASS